MVALCDEPCGELVKGAAGRRDPLRGVNDQEVPGWCRASWCLGALALKMFGAVAHAAPHLLAVGTIGVA